MFTKIDKAITAFVLTTGGVIGAAPVTGGAVSETTLVTGLVLGIIAAIGVFAVPNKPA